jgi:hypothetical protein
MEFSPTVTPGNMVAPAPTQAFLFIRIDLRSSCFLFKGLGGYKRKADQSKKFGQVTWFGLLPMKNIGAWPLSHHRYPGTTEWQSCRLYGEGHGRMVSADKVKRSKLARVGLSFSNI